MPVSTVAVVPPAISSHHQTHEHDSATYQHKYKKLKQLVKETIFVSDFHFFAAFSDGTFVGVQVEIEARATCFVPATAACFLVFLLGRRNW